MLVLFGFGFFLPVILFILLDHVVKPESSVSSVCPLPQIIKVASHIDHYF